MGWDGCEGGTGTDLDGIGWYGRSGMGMRACDWVGEPRVAVKGPFERRESVLGFCFFESLWYKEQIL